MKKILLFAALALIVVSSVCYHAFKKKISYFSMKTDPYYNNIVLQKVDTNTVNIVVPSLKKFNGEVYIAQDLSSYFQSKGKKVKIISAADYANKKTFDAFGRAVNIFIFGHAPCFPNKSGVNLAYVMFPQLHELVYSGFDIVVSASLKYSSFLASKGFPSTYIPQFSNPKRFYYEPLKEQINVLFIGN
ncbi:MAG: hypothetical protein J5896_02105, partial [Alphaproteobacteria bacterium]|nr:hypothetical protein [Alphaproteobacteria bacterium]